MDLFELFKFLHVVAAAAWVGGAILSQAQILWVRSRSDQSFAEFIDFQAWLSTRYFAPLSMLVLTAGIGMVIVSGYNFTDGWVLVGLVLYAITTLNGMFYLGPETEKVKEGLATGPRDTALQARIDRVTLATRIDAAVLVLVVADMVIKPF
jgi:uncharacterized membrane protein